ncbi:unnamed protein product [Anisakis simplex]|uniref:DNA-directed RNA polymerase n=1 Tax=Anisakis simplex TaxID=6269 RepID=A0A0M3KGJ7_ANISI|nr:unnamed protein product [Anisakis simplex]
MHPRYLSASAPGLLQSKSIKDLRKAGRTISRGSETLVRESDIEQSQPIANLIGPIRVDTSRKMSRQANADILIEDRIELIGSGARDTTKKLIAITPRICQRCDENVKVKPKTSQSVKIGDNYIVIERSSTLKPMILSDGKSKRFEETHTYQTRTPHLVNKDTERNVKSESTSNGKRMFSLQGPLKVESKQQIVAGKRGGYIVVEDILLRANGSTNEPRDVS